MKKVSLYSLLVVAGLIGIQPLAAQTQSTATALSPEAQIAAAQANYDAWDKPSQPIGPNHRTTVRTTKTGSRQIVEIGTGMNFWNGLQWVPSNPTFVPVANGFIASRLQYPVQLAGDLYTTNAVTVRTPEGIMLGSSPVAVALYDAASGNFAVIATITNCAATLVESNQVLYPDAFSGNVCASVVYTISQGTFHQDVVFTGPLDPADYGFPRDTTLIQIITEFYGAPVPDELRRPLYVEANTAVRAKMVSPDLIDEQLGFGRFVMTTGKAYVAPSADNPKGLETPVAKEYKTVGDGTYLFESVPYASIAQAISNLPPCHPSFGVSKSKVTKGYAGIPHPGNKPHANPMMAQASHAPVHGVVVDYVANIGGPMSGVTIFQGDTTFLVSSAVSCNGPTTIEGGAIFKYKSGTSITLNSTLTCKTGQYRPAIFTSVDDDAVGDSMTNVVNSGYTGTNNPAGYANPALYAPGAMNFTGLRIRYAQEGIKVFGGTTYSLSHAQFVNCIKGIEIQNNSCGCGIATSYFNVNNCLFSRVSQPILGTILAGSYVNQYVYLLNATVDHASALGTPSTSCGVNLYIQSTNSIYASVASNGAYVSPTGTENAFYSDGNTFGSSQISLPRSPFLTFGAGNYYLTNISGIQTSGITNGLPATLLSDLAKRTTYPPLVIAGTILSTNLALAPQAYRDTYVSSLGYHYDPIDYAFGNVYASNASVTMSGGVAIATFGTNNSAYGLGFGKGSTFSSYGAPNVPDWIVLFNTVQEGTNLNWQRLTNSVTGELFGATPAPSIFTRFTSWSVLAQDAAQFYAPTNTGPIGFQDSEFHGGKLLSYWPTINLTNCLLERVYASLVTSDGNSPYIRNNLFFGGIFNYAPNVTNSFVKDNLFDQTVISNNSSVYTTYNGGYNAFVTNNSRLLPTNANDLIVMTNAPHYQAGPLGFYYQTNTSVLINNGHTNADQVGLFEYTVCTNLVNGLEVKETNSMVDIGYHYVATDAYGNPIDTDGDGIPDYLEDINGNGVYSSDGSGLPNWWEVQYFGTNGVDSDAPDSAGDGYTIYQKYQMGLNPNLFYTPPAPQNFTASYDASNGVVSLNWMPSPGPITGYSLQKFDYQTDQGTTNQLSVNATSFADSIAGETPGNLKPELLVDYSLQAEYGTNGVSASASASIENNNVPQATISTGPQGRLSLVIPNLPSDLSYVQIYRQKNEPLLDFPDIGGGYGEEEAIRNLTSPLNDGYFQVPISSITNGICQLPDSQVPPFYDYVLWVQTVRSNGVASGWERLVGLNSFGSDANFPFVDARQQLKDNLRFLLRAAADDSPFAFTVVESSSWYLPPAFAWPNNNYVYSGFYGEGGESYSGSFDEFNPIHANCFYRNFVFDQNNLNQAGLLNTGCYGGSIYDAGGFNFLPCLTITNFPTYYFNLAGYLTNNVAIPSSQLTTNLTVWLLQNDGGVIPLNGESVSTNNFYGLPHISMKCAYVDTNNQQILATYYPGNTLPSGVSGVKYLNTAQPVFTNIGYYFARPAMDPIPEQSGLSGFATTNVTPLIVQGVGSSQQIAGYAQLGILNSYPGIYAYLSQYFSQAYKIDTNGVTTTNTTGILSPYGNFFATEPGPVALVTMSDLDTGAQGTGIVHCISLNVDKNHDGTIDLTFNGPDATSQSSPMGFWINNDNDGKGIGQDIDAPNLPDSANEVIQSMRDLEDFARLWICGVPSGLVMENYQVTLSFQNCGGTSPSIKLFASHEANGGYGYLTNTSIAEQYVGSFMNDSSLGAVSTSTNYIFPYLRFYNGGTQCLLFEGVTTGEGELVMTITDSNSNTVAQTGVWLDLHDVKDFYEQMVITNNTSVTISNWTSGFELFQQAPSSALGTDTNLIVFVHGFNVGNWDWMTDSETVFKRLYWAGYHGQFASVKWPCGKVSLNPYGFDTSEVNAYKASAALKTYLTGLSTRFAGYRLNIFAHSQGNAVVSEAIKQGAPFDTYILTQGAIPASCFDVNAPVDSDIASHDTGSNITPEWQPMGYHGVYTNLTGRIVNFYNEVDFALGTGTTLFGLFPVNWKENQKLDKPSLFYSYDGTHSIYMSLISSYGVTDPQESRANVSRSRTDAVGATAGLGGIIQNSIDLQAQFQFGRALDEHSAQWTRPVQTSLPYYQQILIQIQPAP